jgi:hypothetical protein
MSRLVRSKQTPSFTAEALGAEHRLGAHSRITRGGCPVCETDSRRASRKRSERRLPPGWDSSSASTPAGSVYVNVWRVFPDATPFELELAMQAPIGAPRNQADVDLSEVDPYAGNAVLTVAAQRSAREQRPDLVARGSWERSLRVVWPSLTYSQRLDAREILTAISVISPRSRSAMQPRTATRRGRGRPPWTPKEFWRHLKEAETSAAPSRRPDDIAAEFRQKDGTKGMSTSSFLRLRRRFGK